MTANAAQYVLVLRQLAEQCYLKEALLWVAIRRLPLLEVQYPGQLDDRVHPKRLDGIDPPIRTLPWSPEECAAAGLPPSPLDEDGHRLASPAYYRSLLQTLAKVKTEIAPDEIAQWQIELANSEQLYARQTKWEADAEARLDQVRSELFLALKAGRVRAHGKTAPAVDIQKAEAVLEEQGLEEFIDSEWEPIPAEEWLLKGIDWDKCWLSGRNLAFALILVDSDTLLKAFPMDISGPTFPVVAVGADYVALDESVGAPSDSLRRAGGRPPMDWDAFHLEMTRKVITNGLPSKQEAMAQEMLEWCRRTWGHEVGLSTIRMKIRPYFREFRKKPETPGS